MPSTQDYITFLDSRRYEEIMNYSSKSLEDDHNFIQWIFPTTTESMFTHNAPIIDIKELRSHNNFSDKLGRSLNKITDHWGIKDGEVVNIMKLKLLNGHNGLRFSRVLQSLVYHGQPEVAKGLLDLVLKNGKHLSPRREGSKTIWEIRYLEALKEVQVALGGDETSSAAGEEASGDATGKVSGSV